MAIVVDLMKRMGVTAQDLVDSHEMTRPVPTFAEIMPAVQDATTVASVMAWRSAWNKMLQKWGKLRLDDISPAQAQGLIAWAHGTAQVRRTSSAPGGGAALKMY
ncbi:hypothetical protein [Actinokineospora pegani]|uniref:hypothetical protein n=1 Tax=Actinokineospora pegani TaxID=2654637 RepID=UPI0012EA1493|nr:hypothetical protein [Actinokineospora pegani]